jgi:hypothetical protein
MSFLRDCLIVALLLATLPAAAASEPPAAAAFETVHQLARAGAAQLALRRIDALQPADSAQARWPEWEALRLQLLAAAGRHDEVLKRADGFPGSLSPAARAALHAAAARSGLALGRAAVAREHAGRALWSGGADAAMLRELRLLVIRSYAQESRSEEAWRSMLRYEQDHRSLDAATAALFVDLLLDAGRARDAIHWLGLLDARGPARLRLRMHAGQVSERTVVEQAQAALKRSEDPAWWRLLLEAARRLNDGALQLAAGEQLLEAEALPAGGVPDAGAAQLWTAYAAHARAAANTHQLLSGDDASWFEFAVRRRSAVPAEARAYFAYLARNAGDPALRQRALERLAADLAEAGLSRTALRLFGTWPGAAEAVPPAARHLMGTLAESAGNPALALVYRQGLPPPENMPAEVWSLRLAALALRAGHGEVAAETVRRLDTGSRWPVPAAQLPEWLSLTQQLLDHGFHEAGLLLSERLLPQVDAGQAHGLLSAIARAHEVRNQPLLAADFHLRAALRAPKEVPGGSAPAAGDWAAESRLQAGLSLARAGLREDARAQFAWVLRNARNPAHIALARRELGF